MTAALPSAYLIIGDDPYLVEEALKEILAGLPRESIEEFAPSDGTDPVLEALQTPSMFGDTRVVVLKQLSELSAEQQRAIAGYLEAPTESTSLLMTSQKSIPGVTAATKKVGRVLEVSKGRRPELFTWLREQARSRELKPTSEGMKALIQAIGEERLALSSALDELSLALGPGATLGPEQVREQFRGRVDAKVFGFVDAVAMRDTATALETLNLLVAQGEAPQALFWTLARHFRMLLVAEGSSAEVSKDLKIPAWRAEKLVSQASRFSQGELIGAFRLLAEADRKIKASEEPDALALERAIVAITGA